MQDKYTNMLEDTLSMSQKGEIEKAENRKKDRSQNLDTIRGCLFGGAVGDALGYAVEFIDEQTIFEHYGKRV